MDTFLRDVIGAFFKNDRLVGRTENVIELHASTIYTQTRGVTTDISGRAIAMLTPLEFNVIYSKNNTRYMEVRCTETSGAHLIIRKDMEGRLTYYPNQTTIESGRVYNCNTVDEAVNAFIQPLVDDSQPGGERKRQRV